MEPHTIKLQKNKIRILFRTSGGKAPKKQLGFGHVIRCINLAKKLRPNEIFFLIEDYGKQASKLLKENGFKKITSLENDVDLKSDIKKTIQFIIKEKIDIIIVDKYNANKKYLQEIKKISKTVLITDLNKIDYNVDLLVNGFIGFQNKKYHNKHGSKCLIGPRYQILDENFQKKPKQKRDFSLLSTFGGFDENHITELLLESLANYFDKLKIKIILGPATTRSQKIKTYEKKYGSRVKIIKKTNSMHKEISNCRFGLCSGGLTTYEFASLNVPFAVISQVKHQLVTAKEWHKRGIGKNLGIISKNTKSKIIQFLEDIINKKNMYSEKNPVDGLGSKRVADEILKL